MREVRDQHSWQRVKAQAGHSGKHSAAHRDEERAATCEREYREVHGRIRRRCECRLTVGSEEPGGWFGERVGRNGFRSLIHLQQDARKHFILWDIHSERHRAPREECLHDEREQREQQHRAGRESAQLRDPRRERWIFNQRTWGAALRTTCEENIARAMPLDRTSCHRVQAGRAESMPVERATGFLA